MRWSNKPCIPHTTAQYSQFWQQLILLQIFCYSLIVGWLQKGIFWHWYLNMETVILEKLLNVFLVSKPALLLLGLVFTWTQISFRLQIGAFSLEKRLTLFLTNFVPLWNFPVKQDSSDLHSTGMHCSCSIDDEVIISHREKNMVNLKLSRIAL